MALLGISSVSFGCGAGPQHYGSWNVRNRQEVAHVVVEQDQRAAIVQRGVAVQPDDSGTAAAPNTPPPPAPQGDNVDLWKVLETLNNLRKAKKVLAQLMEEEASSRLPEHGDSSSKVLPEGRNRAATNRVTSDAAPMPSETEKAGVSSPRRPAQRMLDRSEARDGATSAATDDAQAVFDTRRETVSERVPEQSGHVSWWRPDAAIQDVTVVRTPGWSAQAVKAEREALKSERLLQLFRKLLRHW
jgi:hypothetical protein